MLKIKDNVDLKELEKFGFELGLANVKHYSQVFTYITTKKQVVIANNCWWDWDYYYKEDSDVIYDLIKADLVEKVSDDNE